MTLEDCKNYQEDFRNILDRCITGEISKTMALKLLRARYTLSEIDVEECCLDEHGSGGAKYNRPVGYIKRTIQEAEQFALMQKMEEVNQFAETLFVKQKNINAYYEQVKADIEALPEITNDKKSFTMPEDVNNHFFMQILKNNALTAYSTLIKAIDMGIVDYDDASGCFNFKCDKGCVGLIFSEAGYTEYKTINRYIKINGETPAKTTLANCKKNSPPKEWKRIKEFLFTPPK